MMSNESLRPISSFLKPLRTSELYPQAETWSVILSQDNDLQLQQSLETTNLVDLPGNRELIEHDYVDPPRPFDIRDEHPYSIDLNDGEAKFKQVSNILRRYRNIQPGIPFSRLLKMPPNDKSKKKKNRKEKLCDMGPLVPGSLHAQAVMDAEVQIEWIMKARVHLKLSQAELCTYIRRNYNIVFDQIQISRLEQKSLTLGKAQEYLKLLYSFLVDVKRTVSPHVKTKIAAQSSRHRCLFNSHQINLLKSLFEVNAFPKKAELSILANHLRKDRESLRKWFDKRRLNFRRQGRNDLSNGTFDQWKNLLECDFIKAESKELEEQTMSCVIAEGTV